MYQMVRTAILSLIIILAGFGTTFATQPLGAERALVLAMDTSGSMIHSCIEVVEGSKRSCINHFMLQRDGTAAALLANADVITKVPTAIAVISWATPKNTVIDIPWTLVRTPDDVRALAATMQFIIGMDGGGTNHYAGLSFAMGLFDDPQVQGVKQKIVDISTDEGVSFTGIPQIQQLFVEHPDITVNALGIDRGDPENTAIIDHGKELSSKRVVENLQLNLVSSDGFVLPAEGWISFQDAMIQKMHQELVS